VSGHSRSLLDSDRTLPLPRPVMRPPRPVIARKADLTLFNRTFLISFFLLKSTTVYQNPYPSRPHRNTERRLLAKPPRPRARCSTHRHRAPLLAARTTAARPCSLPAPPPQRVRACCPCTVAAAALPQSPRAPPSLPRARHRSPRSLLLSESSSLP
jgi:hypothetical protein